MVEVEDHLREEVMAELEDYLVAAIKVMEGISDKGQPQSFVGIEFDSEHGLFDCCNDKRHAEQTCRSLKEAARRFVNRLATG